MKRGLILRGLVFVSGLAGVALILIGLAFIYPPAALIVAGLVSLGLLTLDIDRIGSLRWPR